MKKLIRGILRAGFLRADVRVVEQDLVAGEDGEIVVAGGGDDDLIHGILVGIALPVVERQWEAGGINGDLGKHIEDGDFPFGQGDALEPFRAGHGDGDVTARFLSGELDEADGAEVKRNGARDDFPDLRAQLFRGEEGIDPSAGVEKVTGHGGVSG